MPVELPHVVLAALGQAVAAKLCISPEYLTTTFSIVFLYLLLIDFSVYSFYILVVYPFFLSPLRYLPTARGFRPLIGHAMTMFERPPGAAQLRIVRETPNDGLIRTFGVMHAERLILTSPASLVDVLVHKSYDFEKPLWARSFLRKFLGHGILMTEGDEHKHHRKHIMPAFHFRHIQELYPVFWIKSIELCNVMKASMKTDDIDVLEMGHFATQVTLDIIGLAGLGRDIGSLRNSNDDLIQNYEELLEPSKEKAAYFTLHLILPSWFIGMLPWKLNERVKVVTYNLRRICSEFLADKKSHMKYESSESLDILSTMIRSNNFSDDSLIDQLLTFLAAGHETTSSALTWATFLLSSHPTIQQRLRAEIHKHIPNPTGLTSSTDLSTLLETMPYLNGICNEVLRLYPTIPLTQRVATVDTRVGGVFIPAGTQVAICPWAVNRDVGLWGENADEFVPERWIDAETGRASMSGGTDSNYAFLTFLHGPRSCIGERFARAELRALIAAFVGGFEMALADPGEEVVVGGTITTKPVNGMRLRLKTVAWGV